MHCHTDDDPMAAVEQLTAHAPRAAAEAFHAIACDDGVADELRLSAAQHLPRLDPRAAAQGCLAIASDHGVADEVRLSAAEHLPRLDPRAAAQGCLAIASDDGVADEVRLSAAELLPAAAPACRRRSLPCHRLRRRRCRRGAPVRSRAAGRTGPACRRAQLTEPLETLLAR